MTSLWTLLGVLLTFVLRLPSISSAESTCQIECLNGGTNYINYCGCTPDYYGHRCEFKYGVACQGEHKDDCKLAGHPFCFESEDKFVGYDCGACPHGTDPNNCNNTIQEYIDECNKPENVCQGKAACRARRLEHNGMIFTRCTCTGGRGGSRCQFENPCRDNPCDLNEECTSHSMDADKGRRCSPCNPRRRVRI